MNINNNKNYMQEILNNPMFKNFTKEEISILSSNQNKNLLYKITKLTKKSIFCYSILKSQDNIYSTKITNIESSLNKSCIKEIIHKSKDSFMMLFINNNISINDTNCNQYVVSNDEVNCIKDIALSLKPWRKGPFCINFIKDLEKYDDLHEFYIDSEWQSNIKMKLILNALSSINYNLQDKEVLDVGCNNGYYMFDLALRGVRNIIGIDPIAIFFLQFYFIYKLSNIKNCFFRLLGVQDIHKLNKKFDLVLCLGVLYHRKEPLQTLKQ